MKFDIEDSHMTPLNMYECLGARYGEGRTLLEGVNEIMHCFVHFSPDLHEIQ
jgi:hypothetical protein